MAENSPVKIWRGAKKRYQNLGKTGWLVWFTKVWQGPAGFEKNLPFWVGMVRLRNNQKVTSQIVGDNQKITTGVKMKGVLRILNQGGEKGVIEYGVKFKTIEKTNG